MRRLPQPPAQPCSKGPRFAVATPCDPMPVRRRSTRSHSSSRRRRWARTRGPSPARAPGCCRRRCGSTAAARFARRTPTVASTTARTRDRRPRRATTPRTPGTRRRPADATTRRRPPPETPIAPRFLRSSRIPGRRQPTARSLSVCHTALRRNRDSRRHAAAQRSQPRASFRLDRSPYELALDPPGPSHLLPVPTPANHRWRRRPEQGGPLEDRPASCCLSRLFGGPSDILFVSAGSR